MRHWKTHIYTPPPESAVRRFLGNEFSEERDIDFAFDVSHLHASRGGASYVEPAHDEMMDVARKMTRRRGDGTYSVAAYAGRSNLLYETPQEARFAALEIARRMHKDEAEAIREIYKTVVTTIDPNATPMTAAKYVLEILQAHGAAGSCASNNSPSKQNNAMQKAAAAAKKLRKADPDMIQMYAGSGAGQSGDGGEGEGGEVDVARVVLDSEMLMVARNLEPILSQTLTGSETKVIPDPDGEELDRVPLEDPSSQFSRQNVLDQYDAVTDPSWWMFRFQGGEIDITENVRYQTRKQLLYILLDVSGSMDDEDRINIATGVVAAMLRDVYKGESELYIRLFGSGVHRNRFDALTPESAKKALEWIRHVGYNDGNTEIQGALEYAMEEVVEIEKKRGGTRPQIMIVTDGGGYVDHDMPQRLRKEGITLNSVIIGERNDLLKEASHATDGVSLNVEAYVGRDGRLSPL